jgi:hypothetical protein
MAPNAETQRHGRLNSTEKEHNNIKKRIVQLVQQQSTELHIKETQRSNRPALQCTVKVYSGHSKCIGAVCVWVNQSIYAAPSILIMGQD